MGNKQMENALNELISRLHEDDLGITRQLCAIIYRYLERRGRLIPAPTALAEKERISRALEGLSDMEMKCVWQFIQGLQKR